MKRSNFAVLATLLLVFASGALVGVFGYRMYSTSPVSAKGQRPSPDEWRKRFVDEMQQRLDLNAEQLKQLDQILDYTRDRYRAARERMRPEMKQIQDEQAEKIRAMLNEKQRSEYEKILEERERRMRESSPADKR